MTTTTQADPGETIDLTLRLLDHQITDTAGLPLGKVDDLALAWDGNDCRVTGLVTGVGALGHRLPGYLGEWTVAIWRRLHPERDPGLTTVAVDQIVELASSVVVGDAAADALRVESGVEHWLADRVVGRIPGADVAPADQDVGPSQDVHDPRSSEALPAGAVSRRRPADLHLLSELMACRVVGADGAPLGRVSEVRARVTKAADGTGVTAVRAVELGYGRRHLGSNLGYTKDDSQGPAILRHLVQALHRDDRHVPWDHVDQVDLEQQVVRLVTHAQPAHPMARDRPGPVRRPG